MGFTRPTVMVDPTPLSIKNSMVQAHGDFESRLGFGDTGFADRARVQILGRRGPGAGSGVLQGSKTMPAKRAPIGGKGDDGGAPAVTSRCSCIGCRRRTTIRSRPRKKSS